jgi:hypothetical protein
MVARHNQRRVEDHDAAQDTPSPASAERRRDLKSRAARAKARVAASQARRAKV